MLSSKCTNLSWMVFGVTFILSQHILIHGRNNQTKDRKFVSIMEFLEQTFFFITGWPGQLARLSINTGAQGRGLEVKRPGEPSVLFSAVIIPGPSLYLMFVMWDNEQELLGSTELGSPKHTISKGVISTIKNALWVQNYLSSVEPDQLHRNGIPQQKEIWKRVEASRLVIYCWSCRYGKTATLVKTNMSWTRDVFMFTKLLRYWI